MAKSLLVAAMVMCLAAVVFSSALKETRGVQFLKHIRSATGDEVAMIFLMADANGDGNLDGGELKAFCVNFMKVSPADADMFIMVALMGDTNNDGKLNKAEFGTMMASMQRK
ncbi:troponin C, skeletal muscle-like [Argonauta hians]